MRTKVGALGATTLSRRRLLGSALGPMTLGGLLPACRKKRDQERREREPPADPKARIVDLALLTAVADAVLPDELDTTDADRFAAAFAEWTAGFRPHSVLSELSLYKEEHEPLRHGEHPAARYNAELAEIARIARERDATTEFADLDRRARREIVEQVVARVPDHLKIEHTSQHNRRVYEGYHVVIALIMFFLDEPASLELMYGRAVDPHGCGGFADGPPPPLQRARW